MTTNAKPVIVFDVNETLLDLHGLDAVFARLVGDASARGDWFKQLLQLSILANELDAYRDFGELGRAALTMIAQQRGASLPADAFDVLANGIRTLDVHPDVPAGLERLAQHGFRLAALTNSAPPVVEAQLTRAVIRDAFDQVLSVDAVRRYKPAPEPYRMAAERLGVPIAQVLLVAAHGWDVWGAMNAGARGAFVARPGAVLIPGQPPPAIVAPTIEGAAAAIVARF